MTSLDTVILIVGLTAIIIVVVITVRVLTGRGWSNFSKKPEKKPKDESNGKVST